MLTYQIEVRIGTSVEFVFIVVAKDISAAIAKVEKWDFGNDRIKIVSVREVNYTVIS